MNQAVTKSSLMSARAPVGASQATAIEQTRAIAQVQGALVVAMQNPRDEGMARAKAEAACQSQTLAEHAFFRYGRGGSTITGKSVHLARELARCWGNVDYGITELRRDDAAGVSEMQAYAWDLETNARITNTFIVPHMRDKKGGPEALTDMRDIYENNANAGARRLRECIFGVLPKALSEEAADMCRQTLEAGGGVPIEQRRTKLLEAFASINVTRKQLERKMARAADRFTPYDIGVLQVVFKSIKQGETAVADEFPDDHASDVTATLKGEPEAKDPVEKKEPDPEPKPDPAPPAEPDAATKAALAQRQMQIMNLFSKAASVADLVKIAAENKADIDQMPDVLRNPLAESYQAAEKRLSRGRGRTAEPAGLFGGEPEARG